MTASIAEQQQGKSCLTPNGHDKHPSPSQSKESATLIQCRPRRLTGDVNTLINLSKCHRYATEDSKEYSSDEDSSPDATPKANRHGESEINRLCRNDVEAPPVMNRPSDRHATPRPPSVPPCYSPTPSLYCSPVISNNVGVRLGEVIGEGQFGRVYKGIREDTGETIAVKEVHVQDAANSNTAVDNVIREIKIMQPLKHHNVVRYFGARALKNGVRILMEYVPGHMTLSQYVTQYGALGEPLVQKFARQILSGIQFIHHNNIVHRDIKGPNILVDHKSVLKVADFGSSRNMFQDSMKQNTEGTPNWMAPEAIKDMVRGTAADIWSFGCVVVEMLTGRPPFSYYSTSFAILYGIVNDNLGDDCLPIRPIFKEVERAPAMEEEARVAEKKGPERKPKPVILLSHVALDFLMCCFRRDPNKRASAEELLQHPFLNHVEVSDDRKEALGIEDRPSNKDSKKPKKDRDGEDTKKKKKSRKEKRSIKRDDEEREDSPEALGKSSIPPLPFVPLPSPVMAGANTVREPVHADVKWDGEKEAQRKTEDVSSDSVELMTPPDVTRPTTLAPRARSENASPQSVYSETSDDTRVHVDDCASLSDIVKRECENQGRGLNENMAKNQQKRRRGNGAIPLDGKLIKPMKGDDEEDDSKSSTTNTSPTTPLKQMSPDTVMARRSPEVVLSATNAEVNAKGAPVVPVTPVPTQPSPRPVPRHTSPQKTTPPVLKKAQKWGSARGSGEVSAQRNGAASAPVHTPAPSSAGKPAMTARLKRGNVVRGPIGGSPPQTDSHTTATAALMSPPSNRRRTKL